MMADDKEHGMDEARLKRIEDKLDKLADGFTELVRMDEKMVTVFKRMDTYDQRQERLSERVAMLERVNTARGPLFLWLERGALAVLGAVAAIWAKGHFGG